MLTHLGVIFNQIKKTKLNTRIMTPANALTRHNSPQTTSLNLFVAPLLKRIKKESAKEYSEMHDTFTLMG